MKRFLTFLTIFILSIYLIPPLYGQRVNDVRVLNSAAEPVPITGTISSMPDNTIATGDITTVDLTGGAATPTTGSYVSLTVPSGGASVAMQLVSAVGFTGQLNFEGSVDLTNFVPVGASNGTQTVNVIAGTGAAQNQIFILPGGGYRTIRIRATTAISGTVTVTLVASIGTTASIQTGALPAGTNLIGNVQSNSANIATEASLAKLTPLTGSAYSGTESPGPLIMGSVTTAEPVYATGTIRPLSLDEAGNARTTLANLIEEVEPCQLEAKTVLPINQAAVGPLVIIAATAAKKCYICSMFLISATAQNINLLEGTGVTCGTGTVGMLGGADAATGPNLDLKSGWTLGNGGYTVAGTAAVNTDVCLISSSTGQISGVITYVKR